MIDKQQVKLHFSKNAANYDKYAQVQKTMSDILIEFMVHSNKAPSEIKNILEIGCGTGYLTGQLTKLFPSAHITAVDIAQGMIAETKAKFENNSVEFICGDIEEINLDNTYDIIISNATFQWFNYMPITIKKLYTALNPRGMLCFSTFGKYTFHELNQCFDKTREEMSIKEPISSGQSFYDLNELSALCEAAISNETNDDEFLVQSKEIFEYEYFDNCKDFFYSIKKIGANNSNKEGRCTSPTFIKKVMERYNGSYIEDNKVRATYHCLFYKIMKI